MTNKSPDDGVASTGSPVRKITLVTDEDGPRPYRSDHMRVHFTKVGLAMAAMVLVSYWLIMYLER